MCPTRRTQANWGHAFPSHSSLQQAPLYPGWGKNWHDFSSKNEISFSFFQVEHGFLDCSSSDALPSDTLKVVLSANSDGTSPIMELSSWTKTIYWSANNITTRFQLPSINSWFATLFFVCIQQREVNGMSINVASTFKLASEVTSRAQRLGTLAESMQDEVLTQARNKNTSNLKRAYVFAHYEHKVSFDQRSNEEMIWCVH